MTEIENVLRGYNDTAQDRILNLTEDDIVEMSVKVDSKYRVPLIQAIMIAQETIKAAR
jgi:hypothetical protein